MRLYLLLALAFIALSACNDEKTTTQNLVQIRKPTIADQLVLADSIPILGNNFDDYKYHIKVLTTTNSDSGEYKLVAEYGYIVDSMTTQLPYLKQELKIALRRDEKLAYGYILGFYMEEDSFKIFHDYISASATQTSISNLTTQSVLKFSYLRSYYLK